MRIFSTASLRHLAQQKRLKQVEDLLPDAISKKCLKRLAVMKTGIEANEIPGSITESLVSHGLAQKEKLSEAEARLPFLFVKGINIELTYSCNLACSHCLQQPLRPSGTASWFSTELAEKVLQDAKWLGFFRQGLNVTGGETFLAGSPVLEVLAISHAMGIPTRANTNAWWGEQSQIQIGTQRFSNDSDVVEALTMRGLQRLALSLDNRYKQYPQLLSRLVRVASLCEQIGQDYELVATDPAKDISGKFLAQLFVANGSRKPHHLRVTPMTMVDVGVASPREAKISNSKKLSVLARTSDCKGEGFHRPHYLHINPNGGVRSCTYAPGSGWHGNIKEQSLIEILNTAARNPVFCLFEQGNLEHFIEKYFEPWQYHYREIQHGCAASALIARLMEHVTKAMKVDKPHPSDEEMNAIHVQLSREMGMEDPEQAQV